MLTCQTQVELILAMAALFSDVLMQAPGTVHHVSALLVIAMVSQNVCHEKFL